jgi:uncharacterized protein YmfQ (DUF2313 family)
VGLSAHVVDGTTFLSFNMEGAGNAGEVDVTGNGYDAEKRGSTSLNSVVGLLGPARRFVDGGTYLRTVFSSPERIHELDALSGPFTVEWRMKQLTTTEDDGEVFFIGGVLDDGTTLWYLLRLRMGAGTGQFILTAGGVDVPLEYAPSADAWTHYALVVYSPFAGALSFRFYVDGVLHTDGNDVGAVWALDLAPSDYGFLDENWPALHVGGNIAEDFAPLVDFDDFCVRTDARTGAQLLADATRAYLTLTPTASVSYGDAVGTAWTTDGVVPHVTVRFSRDGVTWEDLAVNVSNTGSFTWTAPSLFTKSARVAVQDASDGTPIAISAAFTISPPTSTPHMRMLRQLLPPGSLWSEGMGTLMNRVLGAIGDELARVEERGRDLLKEADPRTATETLPEWERMLGLPDACVQEIPATVEARRLAVFQKVLKQGGQNAAYFVQIAAACGYTVTVYDGYGAGILRAGFRAGARCFGIEWAHVWRMDVQAPTGVALSQAELECIITRIAPAHTAVLFNYL